MGRWLARERVQPRTAKTLVVVLVPRTMEEFVELVKSALKSELIRRKSMNSSSMSPVLFLDQQLVKSGQDLKPRPNLARQCSELSFCLCRKYKNTLCGSRVDLSTGSCASGNSRADGQRGRFRRPGAAHLDTRGFPMPQQERLRRGFVKDRELEKWVNTTLSQQIQGGRARLDGVKMRCG